MENESTKKIIEIQINENTILQFESLFYGIGDVYPILAESLNELIPNPYNYGKPIDDDER